MNIHLHIERLILDGLPVEGRHGSHVQAAVEAELTRLLGENGLAADLQAGATIPSLHADGLPFINSQPAQLGTQIARSVYSGIGKPG
jgi:hypothetical protein